MQTRHRQRAIRIRCRQDTDKELLGKDAEKTQTKRAIRKRCRQDTDKEPLGKDAETTQTKSL